jgi:hypothetical protein
MTFREKGRGSANSPAFSKSNRRHSDSAIYTTNYDKVEAVRQRILTEASQYAPGSEMHSWVLGLGGLA